MNLINFERHARSVSLLAIGATFLGAVFYGVLFYGVGLLFGLGLSLPPNIDFIIEAESLLNDGVGVAPETDR